MLQLSIIMIKLLRSTSRSVLFFCTQQSKNSRYHIKSLPFRYDINISLMSNLTKSNSFSQFFELHTSLRDYFTEKHLAFSIRTLMKLVEKSQYNSGKMQRKEAFQIEEHQQQWRNLLEDIMATNIQHLNNDRLLDYLHFVYKSVQFRIPFLQMYPALKQPYSNFKANLIKTIIEERNLRQFTIPQLVSLLQNLIFLREGIHAITAILDQLQVQLSNDPFCTCFHLILLSNHLQALSKSSFYKLQPKTKCSLQIGIRAILANQIQPILPYIHLGTVIQIYNIMDCYHPQLKPILLARIKELQGQVVERNSYFLEQIKIFQESVEKVDPKVFDAKKIVATIKQNNGIFLKGYRGRE